MEIRSTAGVRPAKLAFHLALAAASLLLLYWLRYVVMMGFVALLIAVLLDGMAAAGCRFLHLPRSAAVILSACLLVAVLAGTLVLLAVPMIRESTGFFDTLKDKSSLVSKKFEQWKSDYPWSAQFLPDLKDSPAEKNQPSAPGMAKTALITLSSLIEGGANALAVFFLAIFLAWNPQRWLSGVAELGPAGSVDERKELYRRIGCALRSYLVTYGIYIVAMGALWSIGLWLIGIEYFLVFGVLGGLVEVAPYVGPFIGLIPPLIMALMTTPAKAVWVILLYVVLHIIEGYLLVPWLMHEREHLPPPIIVLSLLAFGTLFGTLGVLLAVPLGTAGYVIANELIYRRRAERAGSTV